MKKILSNLFSVITFLLVFSIAEMSSNLFAQTWTSIDGGGTTGINNSTSANADMPFCAVYNGEIYAIWQESNQIHIKKYNKNTLVWNNTGDPTTGSKLNSSTFNASSPKLVTYNGYLYAAWNEGDVVVGDPAMLGVHVKRFNGTTWEFVQDYSTGEGRADINKYSNLCGEHVDLVVYNGELYSAWQEYYTGTTRLQLRVSKFNGSLWSRVDGGGDIGLNYDYNNNLSMYAPSLCVYNNKLYVSWLEAIGGVSQLFVKRYDGGSVWTLVGGSGGVGLNYSSPTNAHTPNLTSDNNKLYAFWRESNKVRVKQYDGTNWTTNPDGGSGWVHNGSGSYNPFGYKFVNTNYIAWEENVSAVRQIRVVSFDGTSKTYIDGDGTTGINQNTAMSAHYPKLTENDGDLYTVWNEDNNGDDNHNQIRAKKYLLPPVIESVSVPANGTYITGQTLTFTVNYSKDVVISGGTPYIPITLNTGGTVNATYTGGSGTSTLTFSYTVVSGNGDTDGILAGTAISAGGAILQSEDATPLTANLTLNSVGSTTGILVDAVGPTITSVSSTTADGYYNAGDIITITITCSEAATVTGTPTLALNSGGTASYASGSGTTVLTFNYTVASGQNSADLDYSTTSALSLSGGTIKDGAGNVATLTLPVLGSASSLGGQKNIVIDNTAPTVTLSSTATDPTNAAIPVTITFSESVSGFVVGDITVTNGTAGSFTTVNAYTYTASITPTAAGTVTVNVAGSVANDAAGNNNTAATALSRVFDNVAPTVTLSSTATDPTNAAVPVTITFSESVSGFVVGDISVTNGTASSFTTVNAYTYTASITPTIAGTVTVNIAGSVATDAAGNNNTAATALTRVYDNIAPTVTIISTTTSPTNVSPIPVTITFSESVTGFVVGDISVTNGTAGSFSTVNAYTYTVSITPTTAGTVAVNISGSVATDAAGNNNTAATAFTRVYDNVAPTVTISSTVNDPTNALSIPVTLTFSESVTGFTLSDITVGNATASNLQTSDNINWTADISANGMGAFSVEIHAGVAQDLAGNDNTASGYFQRTYDPVAPTVALSSTSPDPTTDYPIVVNIALSESSWDVLDISDIIVTNGTASNLKLLATGYHENWTVDIYPASNGIVTVDIPAGTVKDYAGNNNIAATQFSRICDVTLPTISFSSTSSSGTESVSSANLQVDLTEASGLDVTVDYTVTGTATGGGTDYTLANGTLTITAGNTSNNITITDIVDDLLVEGNETVIVTLSNPVNATLGTNTVHIYTIVDNGNVTSVSDISKSNISVYPNPFTNNIHFNNLSSDISLIIICDLSGKIVLKVDYNGENNINVNQLTSGVYLLSLINKTGEKQMFKMVKE